MKSAADVAAHYNCSLEELLDFAEYMEVDGDTEPYLLYIVAESMAQPLPADWVDVEDEASGRTYYYNHDTNETSWEHPLDQYYRNLIFIERKNRSLLDEDGEASEQGRVTGAARGAGDVGGGAGWSHGRTAAAAAGGGGRRAKQPKRAPTDEELLFEAELREVGSRFAAFHQSAASCGSRRARDLHKQLLARIAAANKVDGQSGTTKPKVARGDSTSDKGPGDKASAPGRAHRSMEDGTADAGQLAADQNVAIRIRGPAQRVRAEAGKLRAELEAVREEMEGMRRGMGQDIGKLTLRLSRVATAQGGDEGVPDTPVSRFIAEEGSGAGAGGAGLTKVEQDLQLLDAGFGDISGGGDVDGASASAATEQLRQELEEQRTAVERLQTSLGQMEAGKREVEVAHAAAEAARVNMTKHNEQLTEQLTKLQAMMAQQEGGATELMATMRRELQEVQEQADQLSEKVATLSAEKDHLEQSLAAANAAVEELRADAASQETAKQAAGSKIDVLEGRIAKALQDQQAAERTLSEQAEAMAAREAKAAKECERMFKLVQQAHEKVVAKEKEYAGRVAADKKKWDTELEKIVAQRMKSLQKKYDEESNQRRKLFNQIQELKGNIRVYCRVRPCLSNEEKELGMGIEFVGQHSDLVVANPDRPQLAPKRFEFEKVFKPGTSQAEVFSEIKDLATSVTDSYNVCIFAYGQTGSGKTHTMEGPSSDGDIEQLGIYFRSVQELFRVVEKRQEFMKIEVTVNLLEVYNEEIHDLLVDKGAQESLEIRRDGHKIFIPGLSTVPVASAKEVMDVLQQGNSNRAVTSTAMNAQSSRSHSLLIVNVATSSTLAGEVEMVTKSAALTLVDLAGSERLSKSQVTGQARKEAQHINMSLSALADVMAAAASKQAHIPYRNSKLTALLQESLGGDSKTLMLVHCRPTADNIAETLCTLNFATRVRAVELGPPKARSKGPPKEAPADKANASQKTRPKRGARQP